MGVEDRVLAVIQPVIDDLDLELVDLEYAGGRLKVTIDHAEGIGTERLTRATRMINHELDLSDPINGAYTLEVSSPGVERKLRTPAHYGRSIGEQLNVKLMPGGDDGLRRVAGTLVAADDDSFTLEIDGEARTFDYERVSKAKTVFDWGPKPKPGKQKKNAAKSNKPAAQKG